MGHFLGVKSTGKVSEFRFFAEPNYCGRGGVRLALVRLPLSLAKSPDRRVFALADVVWEEIEEGAMPPPSLVLENSEVQELMDRLWQAGIRPTEGEGSAGQMTAVQAHLADMRKLVQQYAEVKLDQ